MATPFKMKGPSLYNSPMKQDTGKKVKLKDTARTGGLGKGLDIKGYLKGEQGLVPDYKGKSTKKTVKQVKKRVKKAANKSTFTNPRGASEVIADQGDARMYTALMKEQFARDKAGKKTSKGDAAYLKSYSDKDKKTRPNKKDRY
tara:strand:- start:58 stop:489 length:432 start_codon:yes stop_codon:yes gene_type:complete